MRRGAPGGPTDDVRVGWVRNVDFEVGDWEGKALRPDVRPMREARNFLFGLRPEAEPPQHADELVPKMPVATSPSPRVARARMRVVAPWIVPTPPRPPASGPTLTAATTYGVQRNTQPKAHQTCIFAVEEGETMLGGRDRQPDARPNAGAILQTRPIAAVNLWGPGPTKPLPPLPVHCL